MSKLAHLKRKAAELEQKRLFEKALAVYEEILQEQGSGEETDIALLNRVGDLYLRQGAMEPALRLYEQAADLYAERGFLNNAIALCNKILRQDPRRAEIHLRLGRVSARNGFRADARRHFLEYATQRDRLGAMDEALASLRQIADEGPEFEDVRILLADLLVGKGQIQPAVEQLGLAYDYLELEGRHGDAQSVLSRIQELDPEYRTARQAAGTQPDDAGQGDVVTVPRAGSSHRSSDSGLVLFSPTDFVNTAASRDEDPSDDQMLDVLEPLSPDEQVDVAEALSADVNMNLDSGPRTAAERLAASLDEHSGADAPDGLLHGAELGLPEIVTERQRSLTPLDLAPMVDDAVDAAPPAALPMAGFLPTADEPSDEVADTRILSPEDLFLITPTDASMEEDGLVMPGAEVGEGGTDEVETGEGSLEITMLADYSGIEAPEEGSLEAAMIDLGPLDTDPTESAPDLSGDPEVVSPGLAWDVPHGPEEGALEITYPEPDGEEREAPEAALPADQGEVPTSAGMGSDQPASVVGSIAWASEEPTAQAPEPVPEPAEAVPAEAVPAEPAAAQQPRSDDDDSYVNLGDWLREDDGPRSTRMVTEERAPSGDEQADFADMLRKFKQGVAENVAEDDHASYYDLGIAYREMGLVDEAIAALQKALRGTRERVRAFEALGQCFLDRGQPAVAASVLKRALGEPGLDDERLVGVLYLLGRACEEQSQRTEALGYYQRVFAVDIEFGDVADRIGFAGQVPS